MSDTPNPPQGDQPGEKRLPVGVPPSENEPAVPFPPHLVERMLQNQANELQLRAQELGIQQQKDSNAFEFGKHALAAKVEDRKDQRIHEQDMRRQTCRMVAAVVIALALLIAYALFSNNAAFATEIIKALVFVFSGGAGGYGLAKAQAEKSAAAKDDDGT